MNKLKQVFSMGGAGLSGENPLMELYLLSLAGKQRPIVMFAPAASLDNQSYINYFENFFGRFPCETMLLATSNLPTTDIEDYVMQADIIYAGHGSTKNGLGLWREWGIDKVFAKAYENGIILSGGSAGMASFTNKSITDSFGALSVEKCLGILPNSGCAHYSLSHRRKTYKTAIYNGSIMAGYGVDEGAGIHFIDGVLHRSVSIAENAKAFYVGMKNGKLQHKRLETYCLNDRDIADELVWNTDMFRERTRNRREARAREQEQSRALILRGQEAIV